MNNAWHKPALQFFAVIVLAHWAEHIVQAIQVYALKWPLPQARGVLGQFFPWLVKSEALHYGYAVVMLFGLWYLGRGFTGRSRTWWMIALGIQFWHHIEHGLLLGQVIVGANLFGAPTPMSLIQFFIRRLELHMIYNTIVFVPMAIGMYYHIFPPAGEEPHRGCTCAYRPKGSQAACAI